jgi:tetratricopeptide (TPR) repeat protein
LTVAEAAEPHLRGLDQKRWLDELELEHDNLRAGLGRAINSGNAVVGVRLMAPVWRFWQLRGHLVEGRRWAEAVLALPGASGRTVLRARGLTALGGLAYWQQDVPAIRRAYEEALAISRELGDEPAVAEGIYNLAYALAYEGDIPGAVAMFKESLAMFQALGIRRGEADSKWVLGVIARLQGDLPGSRELAEESLLLFREIGDLFGTIGALYALGRIALDQGDLDIVASSFLEALDYVEDVGDRTGIAIVLDNLAGKARMEGRHLRALRLAGASEAMKESAGGQAPPPLVDLPDPRDAAREVLGDTAVAAAWEEGRAMVLDQAVEYARQEA